MASDLRAKVSSTNSRPIRFLDSEVLDGLDQRVLERGDLIAEEMGIAMPSVKVTHLHEVRLACLGCPDVRCLTVAAAPYPRCGCYGSGHRARGHFRRLLPPFVG